MTWSRRASRAAMVRAALGGTLVAAGPAGLDDEVLARGACAGRKRPGGWCSRRARSSGGPWRRTRRAVKPCGAGARASAADRAARIRGLFRSMPPVRVAPSRDGSGQLIEGAVGEEADVGAVQGGGEPVGHAGQPGDDLAGSCPGRGGSAAPWCCARWPPSAGRARLWCRPSAGATRSGSGTRSGRTEVSRSRSPARAARPPGCGGAGSSARTRSAAWGCPAGTGSGPGSGSNRSSI